jgi:hypothetical protein
MPERDFENPLGQIASSAVPTTVAVKASENQESRLGLAGPVHRSRAHTPDAETRRVRLR